MKFFYGSFIFNIAGIQCSSRFKKQHLGFFISIGTVFYSPRNYNKFSLFNGYSFIAKLHFKTAFDYIKHFVFMIVVVPNKRTFEFYQLYHLTVELTNNFWFPLLGEK